MTNTDQTWDKALVLTSGGLDSAALLAHVNSLHMKEHITCLGIDYGQQGVKELKYAELQAEYFGNTYRQVSAHLVPLKPPKPLMHEWDAYTPARNMFLATVAAHHAELLGCQLIYMALIDDGNFPDTSPAFVQAMQQVIWESTSHDMVLQTPLLHIRNKAQLFHMLDKVGAFNIIKDTFSCWNGVSLLRPWGVGCQVCEKCKAKEQAWRDFTGAGQ